VELASLFPKRGVPQFRIVAIAEVFSIVKPRWAVVTSVVLALITTTLVAPPQAFSNGATVPDSPTIGSVTAQSGALQVAFTAPASDGGAAISNYEYSTDGTTYLALDPASTTSPITISVLSSDGTTVLSNGTTYPITLKAVNAVGASEPSASVNGTPAATAPGSPTIDSVTAQSGALQVAFTAPASDGGAAISNYEYSTDGTTYLALDPASTTSPITISVLSSDGTTVLSNGTTYPITLKAVNAVGASEPSGSVDGTPTAPAPAISIPGTDFETGLEGWTTSSKVTSPFGPEIFGNGQGAGLVVGQVEFMAGSPSIGACEPEDLTSGTWVYKPRGTTAGALEAAGDTFAATVASLLGASFNPSDISSAIVSVNPNCPPGGSPTNAAWMKRTVTLTADTTYQMAWNYIGTDYVPFNDGSMTTLVPSDPLCADCVVTINRKVRTWALLGFTTPGTGDYSTGSFGSTGWQIAEYLVSQTGDYVLGFAAFNLGDTALSPVLLIDDGRGTVTRDGVVFRGVTPNDPDLPSPLDDPPAATVAGSPTIVSVSPTVGGLEVVFSAPVSDGGALVSNYEYSVDGGENWVALSPVQTTSPLSITGLTGGTEYSVRIRAVNSEGSGSQSNAISGTPTAAVQTPSGGGSAGPAPVQQTVAPLGPQRPRQVTLPPQPPVQAPVLQNNQPSQPPVNPQARVNGVPTQVSTQVQDDNNLSIQTGLLSIGVNVRTGEGLVRQAANGQTEVQVRSGGVTAFQGSGLAPRSFVQVFMPLQGTNAIELARIPVDETGAFNGEAVFATSLQDAPLPIGRHVLQMVTVDEQGRQNVVEFTVNIVQPPPSPEQNRQDGTTPQLQPGQSLATNGGIPEVVQVTALQDEKQTIIEGDGWVMAVQVDNPDGKVQETEDGGVLLELVRDGETNVSGDGFMPGTRADIWLFSDPTLLGTVEVDENGRFSGSVLIDGQMVAVGEHTLQLQGVGMDGYVRAANLGVVVNDEAALAATVDAAGGFLWWWLLLVLLVVAVLVAVYYWWRKRQESTLGA